MRTRAPLQDHCSSSGLTTTGKVEWTPTENWLFSLAPRFNRNESTCCVSPLTFAYRIQSKVNFSLSQDPRTVQGGYGIADFSVGINDKNDHYKLTAFIDNAFDKNYATTIGNGTAGFSAPGVTAFGSSWGLARDSFRYFGARVDVSF